MITWLASYPKSGNTWVRVFLTNYLRGGNAPVDINALMGGPIASARQCFDEWVGVEASLLDDALIERLRPDVYRCMVRENPEMLYMKVHDAWRCTDLGDALFPADVTAGVIYIVRNPLDLLASVAHHYGMTPAAAAAMLGDADYAIARSLGALNDQLRQRLGTWSDHVRSWIDFSQLRTHAVRYEDLLACPEDAFARIVHFCGLPFCQERLHQAMRFSRFDELQRQEREKGFREQFFEASGAFFRRGRAGGWREELSPELVAQVLADHGAVMRRFGYWE
ncbi:MAG: sulfotransferase domain-containing protein [Chloroflexota bacterium]